MLNIKKLFTKVCTDMKKCEKKTLLWTNASPGSSFSNQTLTINDYDLTTFDGFEVVCYLDYTCKGSLSFKHKNFGAGVNNYMGYPSSASNAAVNLSRPYSINSAHTIGVGSATRNGASNNANITPYKIYGIKGGY